MHVLTQTRATGTALPRLPPSGDAQHLHCSLPASSPLPRPSSPCPHSPQTQSCPCCRCPPSFPPLQSLTLENYQSLMYEVVRATNWGSAAFFVAWIIIGEQRLNLPLNPEPQT